MVSEFNEHFQEMRPTDQPGPESFLYHSGLSGAAGHPTCLGLLLVQPAPTPPLLSVPQSESTHTTSPSYLSIPHCSHQGLFFPSLPQSLLVCCDCVSSNWFY